MKECFAVLQVADQLELFIGSPFSSLRTRPPAQNVQPSPGTAAELLSCHAAILYSQSRIFLHKAPKFPFRQRLALPFKAPSGPPSFIMYQANQGIYSQPYYVYMHMHTR